MAAGKLNLYVEQGATFSRVLTINDSNGDPVNLSTWTFAGQVRSSYSSSSVIVSLTFTVKNQTTNTGEVEISLTATQTSAIPATGALSRYVYDIEATIGSEKRRVVEGEFQLSAEVTR